MSETKQCPYCAESIHADAIKCKHCGEFLTPPQPAPRNSLQPHDNFRRGIVQAHDNYGNKKILYTELFIIAVICGAVWKSWWIFGGVWVGLSLLLSVKVLNKVMCVLLSLGWAVGGLAVGMIFGSDAASYVLALLAFLAGLGVHFGALQYHNDL